MQIFVEMTEVQNFGDMMQGAHNERISHTVQIAEWVLKDGSSNAEGVKDQI